MKKLEVLVNELRFFERNWALYVTLWDKRCLTQFFDQG